MRMNSIVYNEVNECERSATLWDPYATRASGASVGWSAALYVWYKDPQAPGPRPRAGISHQHSEGNGEVQSVNGVSRRGAQ